MEKNFGAVAHALLLFYNSLQALFDKGIYDLSLLLFGHFYLTFYYLSVQLC